MVCEGLEGEFRIVKFCYLVAWFSIENCLVLQKLKNDIILFQLRSRSSAWLERRADKGLLSLEKKVSLEIEETTIVVF